MVQMVRDDDPDNHKATKELMPSLLCHELPLCISVTHTLTADVLHSKQLR
jgi:hypothetical protein